MKEIPQERHGKAFWIVLIKRINGEYPLLYSDKKKIRMSTIGLALYLNKSGGWFSGYEVHNIRFRKSLISTMKNKEGKPIVFPDSEYISTSEEFGQQAWSYMKLKSLYKDFPMFKQFHDEIKKTIENTDFKHSTQPFVID